MVGRGWCGVSGGLFGAVHFSCSFFRMIGVASRPAVDRFAT